MTEFVLTQDALNLYSILIKKKKDLWWNPIYVPSQKKKKKKNPIYVLKKSLIPWPDDKKGAL